MLKASAICLLRVFVKMGKNVGIRVANEAAGKPIASIFVEGVIAITDDMVEQAFKWFAQMRTSTQQRQEIEDLGNASPDELDHALDQAIQEEAPDATPRTKQIASMFASRFRANLHAHMSQPDVSGRSTLNPGVQIASAADFARLLRQPDTLAPDEEVAGRYRVIRWIASGGMGSVYLAHDRILDENLVLKTILPSLAKSTDATQRFLDECRLARKLSHPHIVRVHDVATDEQRGIFFLTMEFLPGASLAAWLRRRPRGATPAEFGRVADALCDALEYAHRRGVLHLDLKPSNVIVTDDLSGIWIVDFGLGKARKPEQAMVSSIGGTPYYMAPEQIRGDRVDDRADVYSLGVLLYELLTGSLPVAGSGSASEEHPGIDPALSDAIRTAMRTRADHRFSSVAAFRGALRVATGDGAFRASTLDDARVPALRTSVETEAHGATLELIGDDGAPRTIRYRRARPFELGEMYYGCDQICYVVRQEFADLFENARNVIGSFPFANDDMEQEIARYLPSVIDAFTTPDGSCVMIVALQPGQFLLRDVLEFLGGRIDPRHVAWILSSFHHLACYLAFARVTHNGISPDSCFISPGEHSGQLLGGWWYAATRGARLHAMPSRVLTYAPPDVVSSKTADPRLDLMLLRAMGRELLGDISGAALATDKDIPKPLADFLRGQTSGSAVEDYRRWMEEILPASFGPRRFTPMEISDTDIYKD